MSRPAITMSKLGSYGRLGNQMFQIAAILGQFDRYTPRVPGWGTNDYNKWNYASYFPRLITHPPTEEYPIYREPQFSYSRIPDPAGRGIDLSGYFQTEKYFENFRHGVRESFTFRDDIIGTVKYLYLGVEWDKTCAIHIRRGDYVEKQDYHPLISPSYYKKGIEMTPATFYLVFSDDLEWCKKLDIWPPNTIFARTCPEYYPQEIIDLCAMSMSRYHIIANSTFSWWGAWLAEQRDPSTKIIYPTPWFADPSLDTRDLIPNRSSWTSLPARNLPAGLLQG